MTEPICSDPQACDAPCSGRSRTDETGLGITHEVVCDVCGRWRLDVGVSWREAPILPASPQAPLIPLSPRP